MTSVLVGFGTLVAVIVVGWVAGRAPVLGDGAAGVLSRLSYFVATPALPLLTLAEADPGVLWSPALVATAGSAVPSGLLFAGLAWWRWRSRPAELATGELASSYVNAGNLGVPMPDGVVDEFLVDARLTIAPIS